MTKTIAVTCCATALGVCLAAGEGVADELKLPAFFSDSMVLQAGLADPVWGTATPGATVKVTIAGQEKTATVGPDGKWALKLAALKPGGPYELTAESAGKVMTIKDVLVGEVWVCSGQSNMQFTLKDAANAKTEIPLATNGQLRFCNGKAWTVCSPQSAAGFTAVGYFFAKELNARLGVPVGVINASVGGTPVESWTAEATLRALPALQEAAAKCDANAKLQKEDAAAFKRLCAEDRARVDAGLTAWRLACVANDIGTKEKWFAPTAKLDKWDPAKLPMLNAEDGFGDLGSVWYRREVEIPAAWVGKRLTLNLPGIDDVDITYVNGQEVGRTWYDTCPDFWKVPRHYTVPAEAVTANKLSITIMTLNVYGIGGMFGKAEELALALTDDTAAAPLALAGDWLVRRGSSVDLKAKPRSRVGTGLGGSLYNALIAPLQPYGIKGALWYQGENNAEEPDLYAAMFPAMIKNWREAWGEGNFPFYFVSLAGYMGHQELAVEKLSWAEIREAQKSGLSLSHTGMAMAYDIGDANDIHPKNKIDVGHRLAVLALANDYGLKIECQGPVFRGMEVAGDKVHLRFSHADGMAPKGSELKGFAVAGKDKVFHFAKASIEGGVVILAAADGLVPKPVAVRYAWASIPAGNLYNSAGLPAVPFRTDKWRGDEIATAGPGCR